MINVISLVIGTEYLGFGDYLFGSIIQYSGVCERLHKGLRVT